MEMEGHRLQLELRVRGRALGSVTRTTRAVERALQLNVLSGLRSHDMLQGDYSREVSRRAAVTDRSLGASEKELFAGRKCLFEKGREHGHAVLVARKAHAQSLAQLLLLLLLLYQLVLLLLGGRERGSARRVARRASAAPMDQARLLLLGW
jgi:hypothetical protein